ncbi:hypothetical protein VMCG_10565 [Cytospora schulzeri]|uniref:Protection of telomeres protein 1 n=1 Tax=Cytospora schulzeri TaxID=448051 RepID=A0A423V9X8_9PEZI|nr:hypothetical protein VMCG_10565 [Valsa malicola]
MSRHQPPLPKGFTSIRDVLDGKFSSKIVSVIGVVKDYLLPRSTAGPDWKSRISLYDHSTEEEGNAISLEVFLPKDQMPDVQAGDIIIASRVTRQEWQGSPSLKSNHYASDIHVYDAPRIASCRGARSARGALKPSSREVHRNPEQEDEEYVLWLYNKIDNVPDREQVASRAEQTLNIKDKFTLLQDAEYRKFADLIVQVVKEPYDLGDKMTLWVSDYTENSNLFNKTNNASDWTDGMPIRDGDAYGYTSKWSKPARSTAAEEKWMGPCGHMSIQLTCWEPHADFIRSNVQVRDWIHLHNVEIGHGKSGVMNMEGFLRTDRHYPGRVYVKVLDSEADRETLDPRLIEAIRRKRDYEKHHRQTLKGNTKTKGEGPKPQSGNRDGRRKRKREEKARELREQEAKQEALLGLNDHIKCEHADKKPVPLSSILEPVRYDTTFELPFTCAKYRTQARVVDFHPASLQDFAVRRKIKEYACLSDNSESDSSTSSERTVKSVWEWRFALKLEEASSTSAKGKKPASLWVVVDNLEGQLLTDLDAVDLRSDDHVNVLEMLRQRMFILWGDLEERKSDIEARKSNICWKKPPAHSDDEDNGGGAGHVPSLSQTSNKPFTCCIRQYGVKVMAEEGEEANAGDGKKWQRVFGLFGIKIASD